VIEFTSFSYKLYMTPRSKRVIKTRTISQVLLDYVKAVGVNDCMGSISSVLSTKCRLPCVFEMSLTVITVKIRIQYALLYNTHPRL